MKEPVEIKPPGLPIQVVLLLAAAVFINYVDRGNLATASPLLKDELGLSHSQIGVLLSAFFWSYAPLQPVTGWLARAARRRPVDGNPEPGRQPFGSGRAACHGLRRRSHRPLLLGVCHRSGNHPRRLAGVRYRDSLRRASRLG